MASSQNPFITTGYRSSEYFCDRKEETNALISNLLNGQSTSLLAIRRIGKTGLIHHVLSKLPKGFTGIYLDILPTESLSDLLNALATAVFTSIPEKGGAGKKIISFIRSLRPLVTFDPLTGTPALSFEVRPGETEKHIQAVISKLEEYPGGIVIAIDEFQQILNYPEKNTDALLRGIIQSLSNIRFIFSGSQQHLMTQLFADPSRPFYRSTDIKKIGKIKADEYASFIQHHFQNGGISTEIDTVYSLLEWADLHTYYVQLLCNKIYAAAQVKVDDDVWKEQAARLLQEQEIIFFKYRDLLTKHQWNLLKSIAQEGRVYTPTSKDFMMKHRLGSPATVLRSLESLMKKEMIYSDFDDGGRSFYSVYDVLFRRWMESR